MGGVASAGDDGGSGEWDFVVSYAAAAWAEWTASHGYRTRRW
jgi:hypothetical protein